MARVHSPEQQEADRRVPGGVRADAPDPAVRDRDAPSVPPRRGPRDHPPLRGPGGGRRRRLHGARRRRLRRRDLPRSRPRAGQGHRPRAAGRRDARPRQRRLRRPRRLDERDRPRARTDRLLRDRRRVDRGRARRRRLGQAPGPRRGLLLRRRRRQPGLLPRVPEHGRGSSLPAVFVCENNLYGEFTPMAGGHRGRRHRRPRRRLRHAVGGGRRQRPVGRPRRRDRGGHPGARRTGPDAARVPDLPPLRPFQERPGPVPAQGRRSSTGSSAIRSSSPARGCSTTASPRSRSPPSKQAITAELDQAVESALAAPYPDPAQAAATEFSG